MATSQNWLDRAVGFVAPQRGLQRLRARAATETLRRHYEAATVGRRTQGWRRSISDANAAAGPSLSRLREVARDLVRNNPYAESALSTICDHVVGWGIEAKPIPASEQVAALWQAWAGSTACDADGLNDFYGLQKLAMRTVVESGEVIVRRLFRPSDAGRALPIQLQVLEPDFLDTLREGPQPGGGQVIQGIEFDAFGRRVAYWLFSEHPGSRILGRSGTFGSKRIPAEDILHVFKPARPGQVRAPSWFAPVLLRFKDFDEYEDATLMKQKIAACLAVITSDVDGTGAPLGTPDNTQSPAIDSIEPGMIINAPAGRKIEVVQPPAVREFADYARTTLRAIATGLGVTYEDLTGDYTGMPFSAARMSRLRHWARIEDWRWRVLIPGLCNPAWVWAMQAAQLVGLVGAEIPAAEWTGQPAPMVDPANEGKAYRDNVRSGIMSLSEALRERGYQPEAVLREIASDNKLIDELGLVLDTDPRKTSRAGLTQARPGGTVIPDPNIPDEPPEPAAPKPPKPAAEPDEDEDDQEDE